MKLKIHPLAEMIPAMSEEEYRDLREDIRENGQAEPIVLYRGEVLDGRHRSRACEELKVQPLIREYTGDQPAAYVLSLNVKRRNLTPSQRSAIVVEFLPQLEKEALARKAAAGASAAPGRPAKDRDRGPGLSAPERRARDEAGALAGVSGRSVARAARIKEQAPEEFERVKAGEATVKEVDNRLQRRSTPQNADAAPPEKAVSKREAASSAKRLRNLVQTLTNTQTLLRETNVPAAMQNTDPEEATEWAQQLRSVRTSLTKLVTALEARA